MTININTHELIAQFLSPMNFSFEFELWLKTRYIDDVMLGAVFDIHMEMLHFLFSIQPTVLAFLERVLN